MFEKIIDVSPVIQQEALKYIIAKYWLQLDLINILIRQIMLARFKVLWIYHCLHERLNLVGKLCLCTEYAVANLVES